ncbi:hypothetical protein SAMN05444008_11289 [Cnuella takakiae]|uniref:DNA replication protein DnaC n=1 Tax=Cnuella takakiae TaxID=1302690 RepID=A0A1M5EL51_9BACT|nr:hypothetical protein [Cnuella takakiae]OLY91215.1 hypothetical protein BUE76_04345 [Cnuella takakiae]SHF79906.1 hypothetical protein SAMN05444008_11289 [Cnuella takakiae]
MAIEQDSKTRQVWIPEGGRITLTFGEYKEFLLTRAKEIEPKFEVDEHFKKILTPLSLYFWRLDDFENKGYGLLNKGLFITGNVGVGKTLLMKLFCQNAVRPLRVLSTNIVADTYQEHGIEYLRNKYCSGPTNYSHSNICFDDLGAERIGVKHMGNDINVMEQVILNRYEQGQHNLTHFTSNLDAVQIEKLYGTRVRSRLREMVNFFEFGGEDRRE